MSFALLQEYETYVPPEKKKKKNPKTAPRIHDTPTGSRNLKEKRRGRNKSGNNREDTATEIIESERSTARPQALVPQSDTAYKHWKSTQKKLKSKGGGGQGP